MKEYTLTWGWNPPLYEIRKDKFVRHFVYSDSYEETVKYTDHETGEEKEKTITSWRCKVYEKESAGLAGRLRRNDVEAVREVALECVSLYNVSDKVDEFTVGGHKVWLDKDTRSGLRLRFKAEKAAGITDTSLWYNGLQFPMTVDTALDLLLSIELYASDCYNMTEQHIANIKALESIDDIKAYDYTAGYPEKLTFEL